MRQLTTAVAAAAIGVLVAACGDSNQGGSGSTTTTTSTRPPVAQAALAGLLLTPAEVDGLLGLTGTKSKEKVDKLLDDTVKPWSGGVEIPR
jgi:hypothetical protein